MSNDYRGGNSRQLAKTLDLLDKPAAILDRKGQIVFVNAALCHLAKADATQLVGRQTSWEIASDETPHAAILTALAPPAGARSGRITARQLSTPVVFGSSATGQLFVPITDNDHVVQFTLVVLGGWQEIASQVKQIPSQLLFQEHEQVLVEARSKWNRLDGLHALIGESPAIRLAMNRSQLAIASPCNYFIHGPPHVGKSTVVKGIFACRLKVAGLQPATGQCFPIDCSILDGQFIDGLLEVFAGRLRPGASPVTQQLILERIDTMPLEAVPLLRKWLEGPLSQAVVAATSRKTAHELARRGDSWRAVVNRIAVIEIEIPALRDRREDIPAVAQQILAVTCRKAQRALLNFAPAAMDLLTAYPWPNNLSEMTTAIEEAVNLAVLTHAIQVAHLPVEVRTFASTASVRSSREFAPINLDDLLLDLEKIILRRALKLSPRNRAQVARWLEISRPRLLRRIAQLGLDTTTAPPKSDDDSAETSSN